MEWSTHLAHILASTKGLSSQPGSATYICHDCLRPMACTRELRARKYYEIFYKPLIIRNSHHQVVYSCGFNVLSVFSPDLSDPETMELEEPGLRQLPSRRVSCEVGGRRASCTVIAPPYRRSHSLAELLAEREREKLSQHTEGEDYLRLGNDGG